MVTAAALVSGVLISGLAFAGVRGLIRTVSGEEAKTAGETYPGDGAGMIPGKDQDGGGSQEDQTGPQEESVFPAGMNAGHVDLAGLTPEQAKGRLEEGFAWKLQVTDGENQAAVPDYLADWLRAVTGRLQNGVVLKAGDMQPDYDAVKERLRGFASELAGQWDRQPMNSQAESFDRATGVYTYTQEQRGRKLDQEKLADSLLEAVKTGRLDEVVTAEFAEQEPERTRQQAKAQYKVIGTFTTKTTDNKNRNQNIKLAVDAIDGTVLQPGEEFSFNMATGNRTSEKGYQPAGAYKNGILIEEPGGGVCQVSTTLYHAIIQSGFRTTERNAHSFAPTYVEKGQDAMVSFDGYAGPDLKFVNTGKSSVVLRASFAGRELKMSIVGLPILDEGVEVSIRSEKVRDVDPGEAVYEENPELPFGTEKAVENPASGSVWKSYRILKKNGEVIEEKPLHNSSYKAKNGIIQRNTTAQNQAGAETGADGQAAEGGQPAVGAEDQAGAPGQNGAENTTSAGNAAGAGNTTSAGNAVGAVNPSGNGNTAGTSQGSPGADGQGAVSPQAGLPGQSGPDQSGTQAQPGNGPEGIVIEPNNTAGATIQ